MTVDDIALTMLPGFGIKTVNHLIECFGSAEAVFSATEDELTGMAELKPALARKIINRESHPAAGREMEFITRNRIDAFCSTDEGYPRRLLECSDYPHVIYVKGAKDLNAGPWLSVVGTRRITPYGIKMCDAIIGQLAAIDPNITIVSGLAFGVDVEAHRAALKYGLHTVSVVAHGLTQIYPSQHRNVARSMVENGGAVITEFPSDAKIERSNFVQRNRIIAGLSDATLIVESAAKAGSLITADMAHGYDREVFAVPGRVGDTYSEGTNALIKSMKAQMACSGTDIAEAMNWIADRPVPVQASLFDNATTEEMSVLSILGTDPLSREQITDRSGLGFARTAETLLMMELSGRIRLIPGRGYIKI